MKRSAVLAFLFTSTALASASIGDSVDTGYYIADGVVLGNNGYVLLTSSRFYDSAKLTYSSTATDSLMCWAHSFTNSAQYWQTYYGIFAKNKAPYGADSTASTWSKKVTKLQIANDFRTYFKNTGGTFSLAANWFMKGEAPVEKLKLLGDSGGYYSEYFADSSPEIKHNVKDSDMGTLTSAIFNAFGISSVDGTYTQTQAGLIPFLDIAYKVDNGDEYGHTLTCYSFKTDSEGHVSTLYLADPDSTDGSPLLTAYVGKDTATGALTLYSDSNKTIPMKPDQEHSWFIRSVSYINTPQVLQNMLAEYRDVSNEAQVWNGHSGVWEQQTATTEALPTESTGWDIHVNGSNIDSEHHGYYHTYATDGRAVLFDDHAEEDKRQITINGTVSASHIEVAATGYEFKAGENAALAAGADMLIRQAATLHSDLALNLANLTLEAGATLSSKEPIEVTGTFIASLQAATTFSLKNAVTVPARVDADLDLSAAKQIILETSVSLNNHTLTLAERQTITLSSLDENLPFFTDISQLIIGGEQIAEGTDLGEYLVFVSPDNKEYTNISFIYQNNSIWAASIPEPTTATLSIIALAALTTRRKRYR